MLCLEIWLNNKIQGLDLVYTQKKGRKNSTPKRMSATTSFPDGAIIVCLKSNLGSLSYIKFLMYFESIIGILSINFEICSLSVIPSISTTILDNLIVCLGATLPDGYVSTILSISLLSPRVYFRRKQLMLMFDV